jgi:hypothetical protein
MDLEQVVSRCMTRSASTAAASGVKANIYVTENMTTELVATLNEMSTDT